MYQLKCHDKVFIIFNSICINVVKRHIVAKPVHILLLNGFAIQQLKIACICGTFELYIHYYSCQWGMGGGVVFLPLSALFCRCVGVCCESFSQFSVVRFVVSTNINVLNSFGISAYVQYCFGQNQMLSKCHQHTAGKRICQTFYCNVMHSHSTINSLFGMMKKETKSTILLHLSFT